MRVDFFFFLSNSTLRKLSHKTPSRSELENLGLPFLSSSCWMEGQPGQGMEAPRTEAGHRGQHLTSSLPFLNFQRPLPEDRICGLKGCVSHLFKKSCKKESSIWSCFCCKKNQMAIWLQNRDVVHCSCTERIYTTVQGKKHSQAPQGLNMGNILSL